MKIALGVVGLIVAGLVIYVVAEQMKKDAAIAEVRAANEQMEQRTADVKAFIEASNQ